MIPHQPTPIDQAVRTLRALIDGSGGNPDVRAMQNMILNSIVDATQYLWIPSNLEHVERDRLTESDLAAAQAQVERLTAALAPIMTYLDSVDRNSDPDGTRISDKLDGVNDVWLRRSGIAALRAALATGEPAAEPLSTDR